MIMGPQMNANARKCKTYKLVCGVRSASMGIAHGYSDMPTQKILAFICVHLRTSKSIKVRGGGHKVNG